MEHPDRVTVSAGMPTLHGYDVFAETPQPVLFRDAAALQALQPEKAFLGLVKTTRHLVACRLTKLSGIFRKLSPGPDFRKIEKRPAVFGCFQPHHHFRGKVDDSFQIHRCVGRREGRVYGADLILHALIPVSGIAHQIAEIGPYIGICLLIVSFLCNLKSLEKIGICLRVVVLVDCRYMSGIVVGHLAHAPLLERELARV